MKKTPAKRISLMLCGIFSTCLFFSVYPASQPDRGVIPTPAHERPYFMPEQKKQEILRLIDAHDWAEDEYQRIRQDANDLHGKLGTPSFTRTEGWEKVAYWAAFLYALEGGDNHLEVARQWLMHAYGNDAKETMLAREALNDPEYWKGNEKNIPWYRLDVEAYVAYDWIYDGMEEADRAFLHEVLGLQTRFRMACMDSWGSNPNLNFKPIFMVAFAGMALRDEDILEWGWQRPHQRRQGSFYSMMDRMFKDGAVWDEAAIYAVAHSELYCVATMAFYRSLYENNSWFDHETPTGTSVRKIVDYYVNTAYPIENTGVGKGRIRVVTYGDGATSPPRYAGAEHDMFIGGRHPHFQESRLLTHMKEGLSMAYAASADERYAPFLSLYPDYQPNLWDHLPLPTEVNWPEAPSTVWPEFGIALLRSDESPGYFTNPDAIAAFQMMSNSYGHEQPDKFHINLFGANRLIYPDYLRRQYENRAIGWTYTSASQNTVIVDEMDTEHAEPHIRSAFSPEVKFLATSASGVYTIVDQTRCLMLTGEYLLDLFQLASMVPRTYDYVLHSMGLPSLVDPDGGEERGNISQKYWALDDPQKIQPSGQWSLDFILDEEPPNGAVLGLSDEWFDHVARCRVTMAEAGQTEICYGTWGDGRYVEKAVKAYAAANAPSPPHRRREVARICQSAEQVGMLVARRENTRNTVFAVTHEPYANAQKPVVSSITVIAQNEDAMVVRVKASDFTDYAAIAWGREGDKQVHILAGEGKRQVFQFRNYAWLRVPDKGRPVSRGDWKAFRIPGNRHAFMLNDNAEDLRVSGEDMVFGPLPEAVPAPVQQVEFPFEVKVQPDKPRITLPGEQTLNLALTNASSHVLEGKLTFNPEAGIAVEPASPAFEKVQPGQTIQVRLLVKTTEDAPSGRRFLPMAAEFRPGSAGTPTRSFYQSIPLIIGRSVTQDFTKEFMSQLYEGPELTARLESSGLITYMADGNGVARLQDEPLYTVRDREGNDHLSVDQPVVRGTWWGLHASVASHHKIGGLRMRMRFSDDRIAGIRFYRTYSRQDAYIFTIPGNWNSPAGPPSWTTVIAVDGKGNEYQANSDTEDPVVAAEMGFPDGGSSVAFSFYPPRQLDMTPAGMEFILPRPVPGEPTPQWSAGFCKPGGLDRWRKDTK